MAMLLKLSDIKLWSRLISKMACKWQEWWWAIGAALLVISGGDRSFAKAASAGSSAIGSTGHKRGDREAAQALFDKASALIKEKHYSQAAVLLRSAVKLAPDQANLHHYLGYALWKLDQWNQAQAEFEKAHALNRKDAYNCYFLARIAASLGNIDRSIHYYKEVLRLGPAIYDTNQRLGQAYLDKGELIEAHARITAALRETPWDGSLYYQLGRIDLRQHHPAQARAEFAAAARLKSGNQASIRQLLDLSEAVRNRQMERIQQIRAALLNEASPDPEIYDSIGVLLGRGGFYSEALEPLERAVKLAPDSYESNYDLGVTLFRLGRAHEAEEQLKKALALEPNSPQVNSLLGLLDVNQNRNAEAIKRLRAASQAAPGDERILALLGEQYLVGHYVADAISCLRKAVHQNPDDPALRYLLIEAYQEEHDFNSALETAQDASGRFPNDARIIYEEGQQLANIGHYQRARPYAEKAIRMDPTLGFAYDLMGDIQARTGHYKAALESFQKAKNLAPGDELALKGIAENLIRLKRYPQALSELKQAIAARPQDASLYFSLMQVYVRLGQRQEAAQAESAFQALHAREVAERNAQAPRNYAPSTGSRSN
jgi:tetratricopeptide (TPR) repeat protein